MVKALWYYRYASVPIRFSMYLNLSQEFRFTFDQKLKESNDFGVSVLSFCLMPNHFHLVVKQRKENGIKNYLANISNSYTKFFNTKHDRVGPLLQGTFKAVWIETDEQLLHVVRYIHLNPVEAGIVQAPENYLWSSYPAYLGKIAPHTWLNREWGLNLFRVGTQRGNGETLNAFIAFHAEGARLTPGTFTK